MKELFQIGKDIIKPIFNKIAENSKESVVIGICVAGILGVVGVTKTSLNAYSKMEEK